MQRFFTIDRWKPSSRFLFMIPDRVSESFSLQGMTLERLSTTQLYVYMAYWIAHLAIPSVALRPRWLAVAAIYINVHRSCLTTYLSSIRGSGGASYVCSRPDEVVQEHFYHRFWPDLKGPQDFRFLSPNSGLMTDNCL